MATELQVCVKYIYRCVHLYFKGSLVLYGCCLNFSFMQYVNLNVKTVGRSVSLLCTRVG